MFWQKWIDGLVKLAINCVYVLLEYLSKTLYLCYVHQISQSSDKDEMFATLFAKALAREFVPKKSKCR